MERRATRTRTTLAVSMLALTLIAPWALGQDLTETRRLAEQGDADAQFNLGVMYANGEGVLKDEAEAVRWFRLAADQGNAFAQYDLGVMYANGEGVPQDDAEAVRWFRLAASGSKLTELERKDQPSGRRRRCRTGVWNGGQQEHERHLPSCWP